MQVGREGGPDRRQSYIGGKGRGGGGVLIDVRVIT